MNIKPILKIILKIFLVILLLLIGFITLIAIILLYFHFTSYNIKTNNIKKYEKCINSVKYPEYIKHFPKAISKNSDEAKFYCYTSDYHGEWVLLLLKSNKEHINQELKAHKKIQNKEKQKLKNNFFS